MCCLRLVAFCVLLFCLPPHSRFSYCTCHLLIYNTKGGAVSPSASPEGGSRVFLYFKTISVNRNLLTSEDCGLLVDFEVVEVEFLTPQRSRAREEARRKSRNKTHS